MAKTVKYPITSNKHFITGSCYPVTSCGYKRIGQNKYAKKKKECHTL